jgi:hypothetical protein
MSGLYFRGKLAYASAFARPPAGSTGVLVITSNRGLVAPDALVTAEDLVAFSRIPIDAQDERYSQPLVQDALKLAAVSSNGCSIVLLGSIASGKYIDHLLPIFAGDLEFPLEFVGRGDLSRGGPSPPECCCRSNPDSHPRRRRVAAGKTATEVAAYPWSRHRRNAAGLATLNLCMCRSIADLYS